VPARLKIGLQSLSVAVVVGLLGLLVWKVVHQDKGAASELAKGKHTAAPHFDLGRLDRRGRLSLASLRGKVVVVNFWASWCPACRQEHPNFMAAWQRYRDRGVTFVGISFEDKTSDALAYQREMGGDWPLVQDAGGRTAQTYGVYGVPETFFIGPTGIVEFKQVGYTSYDVLSTQINRLLAGSRS
jgi:cytochrome c biogenesis protein CcmG/thiol:disulfide interchange protein DsbE